ncbi:MAG TPA: TRAP transporter large permease [Burkholderiaceae bacterium]|nr:TRAP transporter large permease [Burkholderiaceae bacterium]
MAGFLLIGSFFLLLFSGIPIAVSLGLSSAIAILVGNLGISSIAVTIYSGVSKYPLLAIPMFIFAGFIFDRSGMAKRLVVFGTAIFGQGRGALALIAIFVAMMMGGISGSGAAIAAAVAGVMTSSMVRAGYPRPFIASVVGAAASTDILIPPSISLVVYSLMVPAATVTSLFAAGLIPGTIAGLSLMLPAWYLSRKHNLGGTSIKAERPPFWKSFGDAFWVLLAKVIVLGGLRFGIFTATEAGVVIAAYGIFIGMFVYRTLTFRDVMKTLRDSAELSGVILLVLALAGLFAWSISTLGVVEPIAAKIVGSGLGQYGVLALITALLIVLGCFLEGLPVFVIMVPILLPICTAFGWDVVWFGIYMTLMVAIGCVIPPLGLNLMVACRITNSPIESTVYWTLWFLGGLLVTGLLVIVFPDLALFLPRYLKLH